MGLIAPSLPIVNQPNSTEEPKIVTFESQVLALVNGNLDTANINPAAAIVDGQLASPTSPVWRTVFNISSVVSNLTTTVAYFNAANIVNSGSFGLPLGLWTPATAGDVAVAGKTTRLRTRVSWATNASAAGITFTWGLYPVTGLAGTAANGTNVTLGTVVSGSTIALASPTASNSAAAASSTINLSDLVATTYVPAIVGSGSQAANSSVLFQFALEMRHT